MSARKLQLVQFNKPLVLVNSGIPDAPLKGLVIQVQYAGLCHSDVHIWAAEAFPPNIFALPRVLGHEISGIVHCIGEQAHTDLCVGDRVVVYPWLNCGQCEYCLHDNPACPHTVGDNSKLKTIGLQIDGGFQSHLTVEDCRYVLRVPNNVPLQVACLAPCSGITAYNAVTSLQQSVHEALRIKGQARIVVVGSGGLGLWAINMCKALYSGSVTVCAVDIQKDKLIEALTAGATCTYCWSKDPGQNKDSIHGLVSTLQGRPDAAVDFTGMPTNLYRLLVACDMGACIAVVGIDNGKLPAFPIRLINAKSLCVKGIYVGSKSSLSKVLHLVSTGQVRAPPVSLVRLDEVNDAMLKLKEGRQLGRVVATVQVQSPSASLLAMEDISDIMTTWKKNQQADKTLAKL